MHPEEIIDELERRLANLEDALKDFLLVCARARVLTDVNMAAGATLAMLVDEPDWAA